MIGFIIAIVSGALMSIQGTWNSQVTKTAGIWVANMWVQFTALLVCIVIWYFTGRESILTLWKVEPKYLLLGGVAGALITWTVIQSIGSLGPARATLLIVGAQILMSYLIELFGMFGVDKEPFEWRKVIGMVIAIVGITIFQWK